MMVVWCHHQVRVAVASATGRLLKLLARMPDEEQNPDLEHKVSSRRSKTRRGAEGGGVKGGQSEGSL